MKKNKTALIISVMLLLTVGAFCAFQIYDIFFKNKTEAELPDIPSLIEQNRADAFSFLDKSENQLPDDARGYIVDTELDFDLSDTSVEALKAAAEALFTKVDAIKPNTVVIRHSEKVKYEYSGFDVLSYFISYAKESGYYTILLCEDDKSITSLAEKHSPDAVMLPESSTTEQAFTELASALGEKDIYLGFLTESGAADVSSALLAKADFCFVQVNYSTENGGDEFIKLWAEKALTVNTKVYGILRNDLVKSGAGWTKSNEINTLLKLTYNYGGFAGCVMYSHDKLSRNDNDTAQNLYSYNEYFNNVDYTALTYTDITSENGKITFSGTTDKDFPTFVFSTSSGKWETVPVSGDDGEFTVTVPLVYGENKISVKHKNAYYTYYIDRVTDVMTSCNAVIENGIAKITVTAAEGAAVYASLANTVTVELTASAAVNGYATYTAEYDTTERLQGLTSEQISYCAVLNGMKDIVMCGEKQKITPYNDHGLGRADICRVDKNYAETTSTASLDDTSDPTCTPQLTGSYGYVDKVTVCDNHMLLYLTSGMKVHCADTRFIVDGYIMPENTTTLEATDFSDGTRLTLSQTYSTFIKMFLAPQNYYTGYLERIYNVKECEAEYIDILFMDTDYCVQTSEFDFSASDVVSSAEWYGNEDDNFMLLRLYLREKGNFSGYEYRQTADGKISITLKKRPTSLSGAVIMLDPGHGGYGSPGTCSDDRVYEHEIVYATTLRVAQLLKDKGATVIITRGENEAVFLDERVAMLRDVKPDLYLSIHNDGSDSKSWFGTHSFYYTSYSMPLASAIHNRMVQAYRSNYYTDTSSTEYEKVDMGVKFYPFMVTRVQECPSVLIECGYLTNTSDAQFLKSEYGQDAIARAITQGVIDYLAD